MPLSDAPRASVIIPTLDGLPHVLGLLDVLVAQDTDVPFEVVVADNGSTDGTVEAVARQTPRPGLRLIHAAERRGRCYARNEGARRAEGQLLLFLDQDDIVGEQYVDAMATCLSTARFVAARIDDSLLNEPWTRRVQALQQRDDIHRDPWPWALGGSLGIHRDAFDEAGGWDEDFVLGCEDTDLCRRANEAGVELQLAPGATLHYRYRSTLRGWFARGRVSAIAAHQLKTKHPDWREPTTELRVWLHYLYVDVRRVVRIRTRWSIARTVLTLGTMVGRVESRIGLRP